VLGDALDDLAHLFLRKDGAQLLPGQFDSDSDVAAVAAVHDLNTPAVGGRPACLGYVARRPGTAQEPGCHLDRSLGGR
jgi:hypothetical protein